MDFPIPEDEDEQLRLAIALSMQETSPAFPTEKPPHEGVIGDLLYDSSDSRGSRQVPAEQESGRDPIHNIQDYMSGLDRRAMEKERLARLTRAQEAESLNSRPLKRPHIEGKDDTQASKRNKAGKLPERKVASDYATAGGFVGDHRALHDIPYHGTIKKTWCFGFPRSGSDIKIEEILQKDTLQLAVLSSFLWDVEWILTKLNPTTKIVMIMSVKDADAKVQYAEEAKAIVGRSIRTCFPPLPGNANCMHSKLMLLAHPSYLRVVVPTANLMPFDWGETGVMENTAFIIDLPRRGDQGVAAYEELTFFGQELWDFCKAMGLSEDTLQSLGKFDFAATERFAFVHTIGGEHHAERSSWQQTGYPGLGRAVKRLGLQTDAPVCIDFVTSSIGALREDFLQMLYLACKGDNGLTEYGRRTKTKPQKLKAAAAPDSEQEQADRAAIHENICLYFPSEQTVRQSRGGPSNGGTICFQERWYLAPSFNKALLRECESARKGLLMHNKIMFVQEREATAPVQGNAVAVPKAWAYVGSANCSESAWGRLVKDRSSKAPKLTCRNWECGVLVPVMSGSEQTNLTSSEQPDLGHLHRFKGVIPVPMHLPAKSLEEQHIRPWFSQPSSSQF